MQIVCIFPSYEKQSSLSYYAAKSLPEQHIPCKDLANKSIVILTN